MKKENINSNPVFVKLAEEKHEGFFDYLEGLGLADDPNMVILSAIHHFYYDSDELKDVKTVVNLKQLNNMKQVKDFLNSVSLILPEEGHFIGSFKDSGKANNNRTAFESSYSLEPRVSSRNPFLNRLFSIFNSRVARHLTSQSASVLLEDAVLKVVDMKEVDGLTYFCTRKIKASA
jgi:hypothetical protein